MRKSTLKWLRFENMNPWLIKIALGIAVAAAAYLCTEWRNRNNSQRLLNVQRNRWSYDNNNNICCICLTEFQFIKKTEEIKLPCRHKVCRNCCIKMFSLQVSGLRNCPLCRDLVPESFVSRLLSS